MDEINNNFIESYTQFFAKSKQNSFEVDDLKKFHTQWNPLFRHHGFFDVRVASTIGIAACIFERIQR